MKKLDYICNCKSEISNFCEAVECHCLQTMKIVHHHANGSFDWLTSEHLILREKQFLFRLGNTKDSRLSNLWLIVSIRGKQGYNQQTDFNLGTNNGMNNNRKEAKL